MTLSKLHNRLNAEENRGYLPGVSGSSCAKVWALSAKVRALGTSFCERASLAFERKLWIVNKVSFCCVVNCFWSILAIRCSAC